jgi:hypothetical protein
MSFHDLCDSQLEAYNKSIQIYDSYKFPELNETWCHYVPSIFLPAGFIEATAFDRATLARLVSKQARMMAFVLQFQQLQGQSL